MSNIHQIVNLETQQFIAHPYDYAFSNGLRVTMLGGSQKLNEEVQIDSIRGPITLSSYSLQGGNVAFSIFQGPRNV